MRAFAGWLLCFVVPLTAQTAPPDDSFTDERPGATNAAFETFLQQHPGSWTAWWNRATGTPTAIFGTGVPIADWRTNTLAEARRHAEALLHEQRELLGLGTAEFREAIAAPMGNCWTFTFAQYFAGLPVIGGRADVRINQCGRIAAFGSVAWPLPADFGTVPRIDAADAARIAWQTLGAAPDTDAGAHPPRLVIWGDLAATSLAPCFLCWEVPVRALDAAGHGSVGRYYVDALRGAVLHYTNDKHECGGDEEHPHDAKAAGAIRGPAPLPPAVYTVRAFARDGASALTPATNVPLPGLQIVVPGVGTVVTDSLGQFTASLAAPTQITVTMDGEHNQPITGANAVTQTATLQPGQGSTIQLLTAGASDAQLAHTTCELWTWRVNEFARSVLGNSPQLASADNVLPTVNIASTCNAFYSGNTINFYAAGGSCTNTASASVIAHEWGHGLDDQYGGISQTHGLSEGWGDICSEYLLDDPIIGDGFFGSAGSGIRSGTNGTQYPPPAEVHAAGEVWMGFAWLFRQNLRTAFGTQQAIALSNQLVLGSIAANATDQPNAVLQVFLADDNDGNLANGTPHYAQLEPACLAHNLPYPVLQVGSITTNTLGTTLAQLTPRLVLATATPFTGTFTRLNLVYNDGSAHMRPMVATGNPGEWQALLPGVLAPTAVTWHVEGVHSSGAVLRVPTVGERGYGVVAERRIFFEDFEHGAPGWTHGATSGIDEWEIGAPQGRAGANWRDPAAAASGGNCAGIDLSGNGAYENGSDTWLRSPPIDCSAYSTLRVRCKRWLSVDAGLLDQAQLRIGPVPFWANPPTLPLDDNAWVTLDSPLPLAGGNPAAVLEFHLQADGSGTRGGWNIDDVEVFVLSSAVPLAASLQLLPEQATRGTTVTATIRTPGPEPFLLILGDTPGPTLVPGIPDLLVGGTNPTVLPGFSDANGNFTLTFAAPAAPAGGAIWYSQVLTLSPTLQFLTSNQFVNLFTP